MPKLYFLYGTVRSAKTLNMIAVRDTYHRQGKKSLLLMPACNTRDGEGKTRSRMGPESSVDVLVKSADDIRGIKLDGISVVFTEESQFLPSEECVVALAEIAKKVPVMCYGLRTDYRRKLFPAAGWLMERAHNITEVKCTCAGKGCGRKSIFSLRVDADGYKVTDGPTVVLGHDFLPVCAEHYDSWPTGPAEKKESKT